MPANNPCSCSYCSLVGATQVTGDDFAIKREFERIERNQKIIDLGDKLEALDYLKARQAKTPLVVANGVQVFL